MYIPVYDLMFPNKGVRAVMEVMMLQRAAEPMAEVISYISTALNLLQVCQCCLLLMVSRLVNRSGNHR